jgi:hypothetical protein
MNCTSASAGRKVNLVRAATIAAVGIAALCAGCQPTGPASSGSSPWLQPSRANEERWTIRCLWVSGPDHQAICEGLAQSLRGVQGLEADSVRVESDDRGSTLYYGAYALVPSREGGTLTLPPEMQRDMELIRSLMLNRQAPFALAVPEPMSVPKSSEHADWLVHRARGSHTLLIAVFYNTPTFHQRQSAAMQYVELLRQDGYSAYYLHEPVKSFVFVGDFEERDLIQRPDGRWYFGPQVERLIASRPNDEFRYMTENGFLRKFRGPDGKMYPAPAQLVRVPRPGEVLQLGM